MEIEREREGMGEKETQTGKQEADGDTGLADRSAVNSDSLSLQLLFKADISKAPSMTWGNKRDNCDC